MRPHVAFQTQTNTYRIFPCGAGDGAGKLLTSDYSVIGRLNLPQRCKSNSILMFIHICGIWKYRCGYGGSPNSWLGGPFFGTPPVAEGFTFPLYIQSNPGASYRGF